MVNKVRLKDFLFLFLFVMKLFLKRTDYVLFLFFSLLLFFIKPLSYVNDVIIWFSFVVFSLFILFLQKVFNIEKVIKICSVKPRDFSLDLVIALFKVFLVCPLYIIFIMIFPSYVAFFLLLLSSFIYAVANINLKFMSFVVGLVLSLIINFQAFIAFILALVPYVIFEVIKRKWIILFFINDISISTLHPIQRLIYMTLSTILVIIIKWLNDIGFGITFKVSLGLITGSFGPQLYTTIIGSIILALLVLFLMYMIPLLFLADSYVDASLYYLQYLRLESYWNRIIKELIWTLLAFITLVSPYIVIILLNMGVVDLMLLLAIIIAIRITSELIMPNPENNTFVFMFYLISIAFIWFISTISYFQLFLPIILFMTPLIHKIGLWLRVRRVWK